MDGIMSALANEKTRWKEDMLFNVKFARQKMSYYYAEVTPTMGMHLTSVPILNLFGKLRQFWKSDKKMDINPEDESSYTTQYEEAFLKYVENEYSANHRCLPVMKTDSLLSTKLFPSTTASGFDDFSHDPYDFLNDDGEY